MALRDDTLASPAQVERHHAACVAHQEALEDPHVPVWRLLLATAEELHTARPLAAGQVRAVARRVKAERCGASV